MDPNTQGNPQAADGISGTETDVKSISDIMGGMTSNEASPEAKPVNGDKAEGNAEGSDKQELPKWTSQLTEEMRNNSDAMKQLSKFQNLSELAKSYSELETKLGNSIAKPGEDASDEDKRKFYQKLGVPETADGYQIEGENVDAFKQLAYKNNLTNEQAQSLFKDVQEMGVGMMQQQQANLYQKAKELEDAMHKEYGNKYNDKVRMLEKGVITYGGKALGDKLKATGLLFDPDVVRMFINLGEQSAEAATSVKAGGTQQAYKPTVEGGHFDFFN